METRYFILGMAAGLALIIGMSEPGKQGATPSLAGGPASEEPRRVTAPNGGAALDQQRIVARQHAPQSAATIVPQGISATAPAGDLNLNTVYTALFNADPRERGGALDLIAQHPENFATQDQFSARLDEMSTDSDAAVAEQAASVLAQLLAWRAINEGEVLPTAAAWAAARTTLLEPPASFMPEGESVEDIGDFAADASAAEPRPPEAAADGGETMSMATDGTEPR